eukprot:GHVU01060189.1.p1 GENE.GHVU01060189.1~~GHVU01060189.1.p1  ORF type:complete len:277 (+),score=64.66 GHVU01060189.1:592-1422(+)
MTLERKTPNEVAEPRPTATALSLVQFARQLINNTSPTTRTTHHDRPTHANNYSTRGQDGEARQEGNPHSLRADLKPAFLWLADETEKLAVARLVSLGRSEGVRRSRDASAGVVDARHHNNDHHNRSSSSSPPPPPPPHHHHHHHLLLQGASVSGGGGSAPRQRQSLTGADGLLALRQQTDHGIVSDSGDYGGGLGRGLGGGSIEGGGPVVLGLSDDPVRIDTLESNYREDEKETEYGTEAGEYAEEAEEAAPSEPREERWGSRGVEGPDGGREDWQ